MNQFLEAALLPINVPYTILMVVVLIYWITVILGVLDFSFLDFDVDVDADVDIDIDADVDADVDADADAGAGGMGNVLHYFNIGAVPFMIILSFLAFFMWSGSVFANYYLGNSSWLIGLALFPALFIGGLFLTKFATAPLVKMFAVMNNQHDVEVVGKTCILQESADHEHLSSAKVVGSDGLVQMVSVQTSSEGDIIPKGSKALIVAFDDQKKCYMIEAFDS